MARNLSAEPHFFTKFGPWPFALAAVAIGVACATVPISGRKQVVMLGFDQEVQLGRDAYVEILKEEPVSSDKRGQVVDRVSKRVVRRTPSKFRNLDWEWNLLASESVNAFAVPGGRIAVYEGILPTALTEAGLASIVGHEVAHVTSRHGAERITSQLVMSGLLSVAAVSLSDQQYGPEIVGALGLGAQLGIVLPFSRQHETESDYVGMIYMAKAGYDPHAAPNVWGRMAKRYGDTGIMTFLSTHPSSAKRQERLTEDLPKAMEFYRKVKNQYAKGERIDEPRPGLRQAPGNSTDAPDSPSAPSAPPGWDDRVPDND